jgi:hypothetical protein
MVKVTELWNVVWDIVSFFQVRFSLGVSEPPLGCTEHTSNIICYVAENGLVEIIFGRFDVLNAAFVDRTQVLESGLIHL